MTVVLNDKTEVFPLMVTGERRYIKGATRDALTFVFKDTDMAEIDSLFTEDNCKEIVVCGDDGSEYLHKGYVLREALSKRKVELTQENGENEAVYEDRVFVTMAEMTYAEATLKRLVEETGDTQMAVAELAEIVMGGM